MALTFTASGAITNDDVKSIHIKKDGSEFSAILSVEITDPFSGAPRSISLQHLMSQKLKDAISDELASLKQTFEAKINEIDVELGR